jgi:hypothetical protein
MGGKNTRARTGARGHERVCGGRIGKRAMHECPDHPCMGQVTKSAYVKASHTRMILPFLYGIS